MISGPAIEKNDALVSLATAFASRVFPVPGGPCRRTPCGGSIPSFREDLRVFHRQLDHLADALDLRLEPADILVGDTAAGLLEPGDRLLAQFDFGVLGDQTDAVGLGVDRD